MDISEDKKIQAMRKIYISRSMKSVAKKNYDLACYKDKKATEELNELMMDEEELVDGFLAAEKKDGRLRVRTFTE